MEIVAVLRLLRRFWLLLVPGAGLAVLVGLTAIYQVSFMPPHLGSRETTGATATGRLMLAAAEAPAVELVPTTDISGTLPSRAVMLADLMTTDPLRAEIARRAGVDVDELGVLGPASGPPEVPVPIAVEATSAAAAPRERYLVSVTTSQRLPLISVSANTADEATARRLVEAVRAAMENALAVRGTGKRVITAESLGRPVSHPVVNAPKKAVAVVATLMVFTFWCFGVVILTGILRRMRDVRAERHAAAATFG